MTDKSQTELVKIALFSCQELIAALEELGWPGWIANLKILKRGLESEAHNLGIDIQPPLPPPED